MKKKIWLWLFLVLFVPIHVSAITVEKYEIETTNPVLSQVGLGTENYSYQAVRSNYYEFIDEEGKYNVIYRISGDSSHLGWAVFSHDFKLEKEMTIDMSLTMFGNAIYDNGYLYVVTGKNDTTSSPSDRTNYPTDYTDAVVMMVTKYDKNGKVVKQLEITGRETSHVTSTIIADGTRNLTHLEYGAKYPFDAGNCDMAVNNGVIVISYAKEMYNGHQMSDLLFINEEDLEFLSRPTTMSSSNPYVGLRSMLGNLKWVSHSFDQRVIVTSDGQYLFADQGDASTRGFVITKSYQGTNRTELKTFLPFHFRESSAYDPYGYNATFANLGNLVEVEDGYILVASSEKTLSINYSNNRYMNEGRNIFIQKYKKDFENQTLQTLSVLNTSERKSETVRTDEEVLDPFNLPATGVTDYGVKWLTDYAEETTVLGTRAVKLDDNTIAILWAEQAIKNNGSGRYTTTGTIKYYYEIIDKDGNVIAEKEEIENATLSNLIDYNYDGDAIYWVTRGSSTNTLVLNRLQTTPEITLVESSTTIKIGEQKKIEAISNFDLTWTSSNPEVVSVDSNGKITGLAEGSAVITISTFGNATVNYYVTVTKSTIADKFENIFHTITETLTNSRFQNIISKVDINSNGKLDIEDIFCFIKVIFKRI